MGLADVGGAIADSNRQSTTRGAHRSRAAAFDTVLLVTGVMVPNDPCDVGGNGDLGAKRDGHDAGWRGDLNEK